MKDFEKIQPEERSGQHVPDGKRESGGKFFPKPTIQLSPFVHVIEPLTPKEFMLWRSSSDSKVGVSRQEGACGKAGSVSELG